MDNTNVIIKMIKKINLINGGKTLVVTFLLVVFSFSFISAFGVTASYWEGHPLQISPGESKVVTIFAQNMVGDEDITLTTALVEGFEIASVPEKDYLVKAKTKDTGIPVTVTIPLDAPLEEEYRVKVSFLQGNEGGGISLGTAINYAFDVLIIKSQEDIEKEEKEAEAKKNLKLILIILSVIAVILVLIYIFRKKIFGDRNK